MTSVGYCMHLHGVNVVKDEKPRAESLVARCNYVALDVTYTKRSFFFKADSSSACHVIPSFYVTAASLPSSQKPAPSAYTQPHEYSQHTCVAFL